MESRVEIVSSGDCRRQRHPASDIGSRSRRSTRPRTWHDATHRESDVMVFLPTSSPPSATLCSRPGARRSTGPFVRYVKARLRQLSSRRIAKVNETVQPLTVCAWSRGVHYVHSQCT